MKRRSLLKALLVAPAALVGLHTTRKGEGTGGTFTVDMPRPHKPSDLSSVTVEVWGGGGGRSSDFKITTWGGGGGGKDPSMLGGGGGIGFSRKND